MKISKSSWHYRYCVWITGSAPDNDLCAYMRKLFVALFLVPPIALLLGPLVLIAWGLTECGYRIAGKLGDAMYARKRFGDEGESIVMAWLRAKKEKVCPLIEYTD